MLKHLPLPRRLPALSGKAVAVALAVAVIASAAIMFVSVTERTREIGIRTAIGARREDILGQFLVEAPALSIAGGAIGVVFGVVGSIGTAHVAGWPTALAPSAILMAFGFAAAVGIFFGYYPARKACEVDPIRSK